MWGFVVDCLKGVSLFPGEATLVHAHSDTHFKERVSPVCVMSHSPCCGVWWVLVQSGVGVWLGSSKRGLLEEAHPFLPPSFFPSFSSSFRFLQFPSPPEASPTLGAGILAFQAKKLVVTKGQF